MIWMSTLMALWEFFFAHEANYEEIPDQTYNRLILDFWYDLMSFESEKLHVLVISFNNKKKYSKI